MLFTATNGDKTVKTRWDLADAAMVVLSIICLILAFNIVLILADLKQFFEESPRKSLITLVLFLVQEAFFFAPLYVLVMRKYKLKLSALGFVKIGLWPAVKWMLKGYGIVIIFNAFLVLLIMRFGYAPPGFGPQESHLPLFGGSAFDIAVAVFVLVLIAPVVEELLFRGFLLQTFLQKFTPAAASVITAVIFSAIHFEFQSVGIMFFLALVLNWIFLRSRSLWPCIGFHMLNNALAFLAELLITAKW